MTDQAIRHQTEQDAITALCEAGECDHPECKEIDYLCPECGEAAMYAETTMHWDRDAQAWIPSDSGVDERTTLYCGDCGHECLEPDAHYLKRDENGEVKP